MMWSRNDKLLFLVGLMVSLLVGMIIGYSVMAKSYETKPWPDGTITVLDKSGGWGKDLKLAITRWNNVGLKTQFKLVQHRPADVIITVRPHTCKQCLAFTAFQGFGFGNKQEQIVLQKYPNAFERKHELYYWTRVLVHELGHVLGLPHVEYCSVMATVFARACALKNDFTVQVCGPMQADIQAAVKLYGRDSSRRPIRNGCKA